MTPTQRKVLLSLEKTMSRAQKDFERDSALFDRYGGTGLRLLVQRHKGTVELCKREVSKLKG
jgi:hypothetical protein